MAKRKTKRTRTRQPKKPSKAVDSEPKYRVWKLDASLRDAITTKRQSRDQTVRDFVSEFVQSELTTLVGDLAKLGVAIENSKLALPVRFAMQDSTLAALRSTSQSTGLDQSQLLVACLRLATRRKRRRNTK